MHPGVVANDISPLLGRVQLVYWYTGSLNANTYTFFCIEEHLHQSFETTSFP